MCKRNGENGPRSRRKADFPRLLANRIFSTGNLRSRQMRLTSEIGSRRTRKQFSFSIFFNIRPFSESIRAIFRIGCQILALLYTKNGSGSINSYFSKSYLNKNIQKFRVPLLQFFNVLYILVITFLSVIGKVCRLKAFESHGYKIVVRIRL